MVKAIIRLILVCLICLPLLGQSQTLTVSQSFTVQATVPSACTVGSGSTDSTDFGILTFGNIGSLANNIDVVSTSGLGSVVIRCTVNTVVKISLDNGANALSGITGGRYMRNTTVTTDTLRYQLYSNSTRSTIWGNDSNGGSSLNWSATGQVDQIPIYARLFSSSTYPSAGSYSDTITITITY